MKAAAASRLHLSCRCKLLAKAAGHEPFVIDLGLAGAGREYARKVRRDVEARLDGD